MFSVGGVSRGRGMGPAPELGAAFGDVDARAAASVSFMGAELWTRDVIVVENMVLRIICFLALTYSSVTFFCLRYVMQKLYFVASP